jgi:hypothetical protein
MQLENTRTLVFGDVQPAEEPDSVAVGTLALPSSRTLSKVDKDRVMHIIL